MSEVVISNFRGLMTAGGPASIPPGYLREATNVVIDDSGIIRPRPGTFVYNNGSKDKSAAAYSYFLGSCINPKYLVYASGTEQAANEISIFAQEYDGNVSNPSVTNVYGSTPFGSQRCGTSFRARQNKMKLASLGGLGFVTDGTKGVVEISEQPDGSIRIERGGVQRGTCFVFDGTTTNSSLAAATNNWLADGYAAAYRYVIGRQTPDGNYIWGSPSGRFVAYNTTGFPGYATAASAVKLVVDFPAPIEETAQGGLGLNYAVQIYRTAARQISAGAPDEEYFLVYEQAFTWSSGATTPSLTITDDVPQALFGEPLYTNGTTGGDVNEFGLTGFVNANDIPPKAYAISAWRNRVWYGHTEIESTLLLTYLGGLADGDTVTVNGTVLTGRTGTPGANEFKIYTGLSSQNIEWTAMALVSAINQNISTAYAQYISAAGSSVLDNLFGKIIIRNAQRNTASVTNRNVTFASTDLDKFRPYRSGATITTYSEYTPGRVFYSKNGDGNAVPVSQYLDVGTGSNEILAMNALDDALYVWTIEGLFQIVGDSPASFEVQLVDANALLVGPDCSVVSGNILYGWTTRGIVKVSLGRTQLIDAPVKDQTVNSVLEAIASGLSKSNVGIVRGAWFAGADSTNNRLLFFYRTDNSSIGMTNALVFNSSNGTWTRWTYASALSSWMDRPQYAETRQAQWSANASLVLRSAGEYCAVGVALVSAANLSNTYRGAPFDSFVAGTASAIGCVVGFYVPSELGVTAPMLPAEVHLQWHRSDTFAFVEVPFDFDVTWATSYRELAGLNPDATQGVAATVPGEAWADDVISSSSFSNSATDYKRVTRTPFANTVGAAPLLYCQVSYDAAQEIFNDSDSEYRVFAGPSLETARITINDMAKRVATYGAQQ